MLLEHSIYQKRKAEEQYLMHYGVLGMKWDPAKRKYKKDSKYEKRVEKLNDAYEAKVQEAKEEHKANKEELLKTQNDLVSNSNKAIKHTEFFVKKLGTAVKDSLLFAKRLTEYIVNSMLSLYGFSHSDDVMSDLNTMKREAEIYAIIAEMSDKELMKYYKKFIRRK